MLKRFAAAASLTAMAVLGLGTTAQAVSSDVPVVKVKKVKAIKAIDWDAPAPAPGDGGASTQRIDWD